IATWNVRTLYESGRLDQVRAECERLQLNIVGLAEVRWTGNGQTTNEGWTLYYSGGNSHNHGVGFLVSPRIARAVTRPINEQVMVITVQAKPSPLNIIQVYMPTTDGDNNKVREVYKEVQRAVILLDWLEDNRLIALNTCFRHQKSQRYTWAAPGELHKNMIDYITISEDSRALVSADCGTDHQLVWARIRGKAWCKRCSDQKPKMRWKLDVLREVSMQAQFETTLQQQIVGKEKTWPALLESLHKTLEEVCPKEQQARRPWITAECLKLMDRRRDAKIRDHQGEDFLQLCREVKQACRWAKRMYFREKALEACTVSRLGNTKEVYKIVKEISGERRPNTSLGIKDEDGKTMIFEKDNIKRRWRGYCLSLFSKDCSLPTSPPPERGETEPEVLMSEIERALQRLKNNKAVGLDRIPAEALKAGGETLLHIMKAIINSIWETGEWPDEWVRSEIVTIPKVAGTQCEKYHTLSLISHASKILLEILRQRISHFTSREIGEEQFGFVQGKGTTDAILILQNIIEKVVKKKVDTQLWLLFVDYAKAFDTVAHSALWDTLIEFGVPKHLVWLVSKLYEKANGCVQVLSENTNEFPFEKGIRQGCLLSPMLFNVIGKKIMRIVGEKIPQSSRCTIGGRVVWNLRYADDIVLLAKSREDLENIAEELRLASLQFGLKINSSKTCTMSANGEGTLKLDSSEIRIVKSFKYLGSDVNPESDSSPEIRRKLEMMNRLAPVWRSTDMDMRIKKDLVRSLVWSIAPYGCESWAIKKLTAFELWAWRCMLKISWMEHKTNAWIHDRV
uniref:Reverse transcriptase domain-containing protein n=1 Tax=Latimeria chalumnae TaxID=7897 RepID=H3ABE5_LATCH